MPVSLSEAGNRHTSFFSCLSARKSCKGVSVLMFYILFSAVVTYIASVLLESMGWVYIVQKSPWLISYALCAFLVSCLFTSSLCICLYSSL